jgi:hypothetical protein
MTRAFLSFCLHHCVIDCCRELWMPFFLFGLFFLWSVGVFFACRRAPTFCSTALPTVPFGYSCGTRCLLSTNWTVCGNELPAVPLFWHRLRQRMPAVYFFTPSAATYACYISVFDRCGNDMPAVSIIVHLLRHEACCLSFILQPRQCVRLHSCSWCRFQAGTSCGTLARVAMLETAPTAWVRDYMCFHTWQTATVFILSRHKLFGTYCLANFWARSR